MPIVANTLHENAERTLPERHCWNHWCASKWDLPTCFVFSCTQDELNGQLGHCSHKQSLTQTTKMDINAILHSETTCAYLTQLKCMCRRRFGVAWPSYLIQKTIRQHQLVTSLYKASQQFINLDNVTQTIMVTICKEFDWTNASTLWMNNQRRTVGND